MSDPKFSMANLLEEAKSGQITRIDPQAPQQNFGTTGFQPLNKYDEGLRRGMDQTALRADNQTGWQALGNAIAQTGAEIGLGTLEGAGYLLDPTLWKGMLFNEEVEFGNAFTEMMVRAQEKVGNKMPVHGGEKAFDPGNPRWWMANLPNIASSVSLMIPALGAAKSTGWAARKLGRLARSMRKADALAEVAGMQQYSKVMTSVKAAVFSRFMENTMEASEASKSQYEKLLMEGVPEAQALEEAGLVGRNVWYANIANLVTDIPQYMLLLRGPKAFVNAAKKTKNAFQKINAKIPSPLKQMFSEGAEEGFQYGIQQEATDSRSALETVQQALRNIPEYRDDEEFLASITLGAVGGAIFDFAGKGMQASIANSVRRNRAAAEAYSRGDWVEGLRQKHDEALDMILDGDTEKLAELVDLSEDERLKPMVERMTRYHEQLMNTVPDGPTKKENIRKLIQSQFYEDATNALRSELNNMVADSEGQVEVAHVAAKAYEMAEQASTPHKERIKRNIARLFGVTPETIPQDLPQMSGANERIIMAKAGQLVASMNKAITLSEEAQGTQQQGFNGRQAVQGNPDPDTLANTRTTFLRSNAPANEIKVLDDYILGKMRVELGEVDPILFNSRDEYLQALRNKPFIGKFGNTIPGASNLTAIEVAQNKWNRLEERRAAEQVPPEEEQAPPPVQEEAEDVDVNAIFGAPEQTEQPAPEQEQTATAQKPPVGYGSQNTVFTEEGARRARESLRNIIGQFNMGINPEFLQAGITLAGYHIEAGARSFSQFVKAMVNDLGQNIKPHLKMLYNAVRDYPGFDNTGMDDYETVSKASVEDILTQKEEVPAAPVDDVAAYEQKLAEQIEAIKVEEDGKYKAAFKPVGVGQEKIAYFDSAEEAQDWLADQYAEAKLSDDQHTSQPGSVKLEEEAPKESPEYSDEVRAAREALLREINFTSEGEQAEESSADPNNMVTYGKKYNYSVTQDVVIEKKDNRYVPKFKLVNGIQLPVTHKESGLSTVWRRSGIEGTVSYEEAQAVVRHIDENLDWQEQEVFLEVDPTIEYHQVRTDNKEHANPSSNKMDYSEAQIQIQKNNFYQANKEAFSPEELDRIWAQEETLMRKKGARGADLMNVTYVIYKDGKRIPLGIQLSFIREHQNFGKTRSSDYWRRRYELWEEWERRQKEGKLGNTAIQHPEKMRFARDSQGNPVYMAGRFLDHPDKSFALDDPAYHHETPDGKHLVLMVPVRRAQGTIQEVSTARPKGRIMNTGNYTPGFPYILVKDTMGNYLWSRVYSRTLREAPEQVRAELERIFKPAIDAKAAFLRRLEQMGIDPNRPLPEDVAAEIRKYRTGSIARKDARFPEVFDFMESGWKKVEEEFKMLYRWRDQDSAEISYHPSLSPDVLFTVTENSRVNGPFTVDAVIRVFDLESKPLQIDVSKLEDPAYVESISWRLKTNTDARNPLVSPTFFFEPSGKKIESTQKQEIRKEWEITQKITEKGKTVTVTPVTSKNKINYKVVREDGREITNSGPRLTADQMIELGIILDENMMPEYGFLTEVRFKDNGDIAGVDVKSYFADDDGTLTPMSMTYPIRKNKIETSKAVSQEKESRLKDLASDVETTAEALEKYLEMDSNDFTAHDVNRILKFSGPLVDVPLDRRAEVIAINEKAKDHFRIIDEIDKKLYESDWNTGSRSKSFEIGIDYEMDFYKDNVEDFIITHEELGETNPGTGKELEPGFFAVSGITEYPIYKGRTLVSKGKVSIVYNPPEIENAPQTKEETSRDETGQKETRKMDLPASKIRRRKPPRFKKATDIFFHQIDERAAREWLAKRLPPSIAVRIAKLDKDTWGYTSDQLIVLNTAAPQQTAYHEAFHAVFWNLATEKERQQVMEAAKKKYGKAPEGVDVQEWYEEQLANDFEQYVMQRTESDTAIGKFFRMLWNWIQTAITQRTTINTFYDTIYQGGFQSRKVVSRPFTRYSRVPGLSVQEEKAAVNVLMQLVDELIDEAMDMASSGDVNIAEEYKKVLSLEYLFSPDGLIGDLIAMGREDMDGNSVSKEIQTKIVYIINGLNQIIEDVDFTDGKPYYVGEIKEVKGKKVFVPDQHKPGPLYFRMLKELASRGVDVKIKNDKLSAKEVPVGSSQESEQLEFTEEAEDTREWWTIASMSISPKERLTPRLRRWMSRLPMLTIDDKYVPDPFGFGMELTYSPNEVYPQLQAILGNSVNVEDMMMRMQEEAETNPLFRSILSQLDGWQTYPNANQLVTQLFTHIAQKTDPEAVVTRQYESGRIVTFASGGRKETIIADAINETMYRLSKEKLAALGARAKEAASADTLELRTFLSILRDAGHQMSNSTAKKIDDATRRKALRALSFGIETFNKGNEQDALSIISNMIRRNIAPFTKMRMQNVHLNVSGSKVYAWSNSNFISRQMNRFAKNFEEMVQFYITDPIYSINGKLLPLLRNKPTEPWRLRMSDGIKYQGERVGRDYTKFSDRDMLVVMLSYFLDDSYLLPVFSDGTMMGSVKIKRAKDIASSVEEMLDVAEAEWMRIQQEQGALGKVANYEKNSNKAYLFPELLTNSKGEVVKEFDREEMRNKALNIIDEQGRKLLEKMKELNIVSGLPGTTNKGLDISVKDPLLFAKEFIASHMAVHSQLVLLTTGDPAFYKNIGDFFKRGKEVVSPGVYLNDKAVFVSNTGTKVDLSEKPFMKMGIFSDITAESELGKELKALGLLDKYGVFSLSDGQTFIDPVSYRDREVGLQRWNDEKEEALEILMSGELPRKQGKESLFGPMKPYIFTLLKTPDGRIKPFQKKDSEMVIYPFYGRKYVNGVKNNLYNPLHRAMLEKMGYTFTEEDGNTSVSYDAKKRVFDMITSDESIKVGKEEVAQFPKNGNNTDLSNPAATFDEMKPQDIPLADWRLQQETPAHHLHTDAIYGIQIMKLIVVDLDNNATYQLPDGSTLKGSELLQRYKEALIADIGASMENVERMFAEARESEEAFNRFVNIIRQEIIDRGMPDRFGDALQIVRKPNGILSTLLPLGHPLHVNRIESLLSSMIRKKVTKRKFDKGYAFVNAAPAGFERMPRIVFNEDGSIKHYEVYHPIHDKRLLRFVNDQGFIDEKGMEQIRKHPYLSKLLDGIVYRTPTEGKYSIFPIHVIGFLPTDDGVMFGPPELTKIAGLDFDIDKVRGFYYAVGKKLTKQQERDNRKIDLMRAAMSTKEVAQQMLDPGSFQEIEDNNLKIRKLKNWKLTKGKKINSHAEMDAIEGGLSYLDPMTQVNMARRFNSGQGLIGIAAVNNAVHAIWAQLTNPLSMRPSVVFYDANGEEKQLNVLNKQKDINGRHITKNIASTVASFVDNGKNPQAEFFNMNEVTANVAYYLLHLGLDLETVQMFLAQPSIVWWVKSLINNGGVVSKAMIDGLRSNLKMIDLKAGNYANPMSKRMLEKGMNRERFIAERMGKESSGIINEVNGKYEALHLISGKKGTFNTMKEAKDFIHDREFYRLSFRMLENFLIFELRGKQLNGLVQLTKAGDKGLGASQVDSRKTISSYERLVNNEKSLFIGAEQIFDKTKEYMANFLFDGIFRANQLIVETIKLPNLGSSMIEMMLDYMTQIKGELITDDEVKIIYRTMYDFIASADPNFEIQDNMGKDLWERIQKLDKGFVESNLFLSSLMLKGDDLYMPGGTMLDYGEEAMMTDHWRNLIDQHPSLAKDLARYSVMRNGFRYAKNGFSHLQPLEIYTLFFDEMSENYEQALMQFSYNPSKVLLFAEQFIRNNFRVLNIVQAPPKNTMFLENTDKSQAEGVDYAAFVIPNITNPPTFMKHSNALYKLTMQGNGFAYYEWTPGYGSLTQDMLFQEYYFRRDPGAVRPYQFSNEQDILDRYEGSIFAKPMDEAYAGDLMRRAKELTAVEMLFSDPANDFIAACK